MNKLEATMYLCAAEDVPSAEEIREQVIKTFVTIINSGDETMSDVLMALIDAYIETKEAEGVDFASETCPAIEGIFLKASLRGYRSLFPKTEEGSEAYSWWPDFLDLRYSYPVSLISDLGFVSGFRDATVAKQMQEFASNRIKAGMNA